MAGENLSSAIGKSGLGAAEKSANITANGITSGLADAKLGFNTMEAIGKVGGAAVGGTAAGILSHGDITSILSGAVSGAQIGNFVANPDIKLGFLVKEQGPLPEGGFGGVYKGEVGWEAQMFGKTIASEVTSGQMTVDSKNGISLITTRKSGNYSGDAARISYKKLAKNNGL